MESWGKLSAPLASFFCSYYSRCGSHTPVWLFFFRLRTPPCMLRTSPEAPSFFPPFFLLALCYHLESAPALLWRILRWYCSNAKVCKMRCCLWPLLFSPKQINHNYDSFHSRGVILPAKELITASGATFQGHIRPIIIRKLHIGPKNNLFHLQTENSVITQPQRWNSLPAQLSWS